MMQRYDSVFLPERKDFVKVRYVAFLDQYLTEHFGAPAAQYVRLRLSELLQKGEEELVMQIIRELEPSGRGLYAGAVGYLDFAGNLDFCIAIRTVIMSGRMAYVQAGAGVVMDSNPAAEYEETKDKARALFKALELAQEGL